MALSQWAQMYGELQWTAGFLDGEGSFGAWGPRGYLIVATQRDRELLDRLQRLFGGTVRLTPHKPNPLHSWQLSKQTQSIGLMMTLYPLMSQRRQAQIRKALTIWKGRTWPRLTCKYGHPWTPETTYRYTLKNGSHIRKCAKCHRDGQRARWREAHPIPRKLKQPEEPMVYPPLRFERRRYGFTNYTWAYATINGQEYSLGDPYKGLHWSKKSLREELLRLYSKLNIPIVTP